MTRSMRDLSTPAIPKRFTTQVCLSQGGFEKLISHSPFRISVVIGTTTAMPVRWLSGFVMETTTAGRTLAAIPRSTTTTSPRLKLVIEDVRGRSKPFPRLRDDFGVGHRWKRFKTIADQIPKQV